ncbi:MAG: hypothetical protein BroJett021_40540 [Chloroflexota bacterium]|nr:MAG: hypothetical protein BroJett021_40540 [Chloroflexota bacterium]
MQNPFFLSAEIRWFWPHQGQWDKALAWFTQQGQLNVVAESPPYVRQPDAAPFVKQEAPRTDEYLLLPNCETVGIKQRQGRLEVKGRVSGPRSFALDAVTGRTDQWVKWGLKPSQEITSKLESDLRQAGMWRSVEKQRLLQKYALLGDKVSAVSPDSWPNAGCNVELTLLHIDGNDNDWMTFGFEAFGESDPDHLMVLLDTTIRHFFAVHGPTPVALREADSFSYPAWLLTIV